MKLPQRHLNHNQFRSLTREKTTTIDQQRYKSVGRTETVFRSIHLAIPSYRDKAKFASIVRLYYLIGIVAAPIEYFLLAFFVL